MPAKAVWVKKSCLFCGKEFEVQPYRKDTAKYCSHQCGNVVKARSSIVERAESQRGRGEGKSYRKWYNRHLHRIVAEQKLGRSLLPGEVVHHIDCNKLNNDPANLEITTQSKHAREHFRRYWEIRRVSVKTISA